MAVTSTLFRSSEDMSAELERTTMASARMGDRVDSIGRYKLPLLPGERGPKAGGDWVPGGIQSATNLAGAIVESRQLGIWERELSQVGLALRPELAERLTLVVHKARAQGVDFLKLRNHPTVRAALNEIHTAAKSVAGGDDARDAGTLRHDVWEERGKTSQLFGTPAVNEQVLALEQLLADSHLERVPGLQERTVRNLALRAAGRFDDVLRVTKDIRWPGAEACIPAGTLLMADLKTKRRKFYSWLEVRIQLTVYATAEWMLSTAREALEARQDPNGVWYVPGPVHHVDQNWGVVLHMPSDSSAPPQLRRVNLIKGYQHALLARAVCDTRSEAKNVAADGESLWPTAAGDGEVS